VRSFFVKTVQLVAGVAVAALCASADSFSQVFVSLGPVPGVSSSYAGYTINAQSGVVSSSNVGNINTSPTGFTQQTSITNADLTFDTAFNNWRGSASPTGAFANEYGTVLFFSVVLTGLTNQNDLSLSNITYTENDNDTLIPDYFGFSGSFASSNYAADAVGVLANGTDVANGTAGTTMVNKIILTGVGVGFDATGQYAGTPAQQLAAAIADENTLGNYAITTCFADSADGLSTCGSVNVASIPEPGCFAIAGMGFASLLIAAGRRKFFRT